MNARIQARVVLFLIIFSCVLNPPTASAEAPAGKTLNLTQALGLNAEQSTQVAQILAAKDASCRKYTTDDKRRTCELMARQQADAQIEKLLTPEQLPKLEQLRQARIENARAKRAEIKKVKRN